MAHRAKLDQVLRECLGSSNVYFQPPESIKMNYPAIVYERGVDYVKHADDNPYCIKQRYSVTVIDKNPDSTIPDRILTIPLTRMNRRYSSNKLHHTNFTIYY